MCNKCAEQSSCVWLKRINGKKQWKKEEKDGKSAQQLAESIKKWDHKENSNLNLTLGTQYTMRLECATQREQNHENKAREKKTVRAFLWKILLMEKSASRACARARNREKELCTRTRYALHIVNRVILRWSWEKQLEWREEKKTNRRSQAKSSA